MKTKRMKIYQELKYLRYKLKENYSRNKMYRRLYEKASKTEDKDNKDEQHA